MGRVFKEISRYARHLWGVRLLGHVRTWTPAGFLGLAGRHLPDFRFDAPDLGRIKIPDERTASRISDPDTSTACDGGVPRAA